MKCMHIFVLRLSNRVGCWLVRHRGRRLRGCKGTNDLQAAVKMHAGDLQKLGVGTVYWCA